MRVVLASALVCAAWGWSASPGAIAETASESESEPGSLIIVVDSSGSMKESDGRGSTRMAAAKKGLARVIETLPEDASVGLRAYGSTISDGDGSCTDTSLLVPVGQVDRAALTRGVKELKPLGNTPIAYALEKAAKDLPGEGSRSILLVSDGEETCGGDPCKVARDIRDSGTDVHVDVVGLQVDARTRGQLSCVASAGGGTYYDADDLTLLPNTLERISTRAARGYAPAGQPILGGTTAEDATSMTSGQWLDTIGADSTVKTYRLADPAEGTIHVAATLRPTGLTVTQGERIGLEVTSADGVTCGRPESVRAVGSFDKSRPVTAALTLDAAAREDCGPGPYVASVSAPDTTQTRPLALVAYLEPGVDDVDQLPEALTEVEAPASVIGGQGEGTEAIGSPSFSGAPVLTPGRHHDTILVGEALYYAVEVGWGQSAQCDVTVGASATAAAGLARQTLPMAVDVYGPMRGKLSALSSLGVADGLYTGTEALVLSTTTPQVRYRNRESANDRIQGASIPGTYYCAVFVNKDLKRAPDVGEVPITIDVALTGTEGDGAPSYLTPQADDVEETPAAEDESSSTTTILVGSALVVLLALVGALVWALRSRRRAG